MTISEVKVSKEQAKENKKREKLGKLVIEFNKEAKRINCPFRMKLHNKPKWQLMWQNCRSWEVLDKMIIRLYLPKKVFNFEYKKKISEASYNEKWDKFFFGKELYYYEDDTDEDYFRGGIGLDNEIFKTIEPVLQNIDSQFKIKLKGGKIPIKYQILEGLK